MRLLRHVSQVRCQVAPESARLFAIHWDAVSNGNGKKRSREPISMTLIIVPKQSELTEVPKAKRRSAPPSIRRGVLVSRAYDGGPEQHHDLITCCHCGRSWVYHRGSGRRRGWCMNCNSVTCGSNACDVCVPVRQLLDNMEAGMLFEEARKFRPVKANVPREPPRPKRLFVATEFTRC